MDHSVRVNLEQSLSPAGEIMATTISPTNEGHDSDWSTASRIQEMRVRAFVSAGFDVDTATRMVDDATSIMRRKELVHESVLVDLLSDWHLMEREIDEVDSLISTFAVGL